MGSTEMNLGAACDSHRCTALAVYACTVRNIDTQQIQYVRLYCTECTAKLTAGIKVILDKPEHDGKRLHDYLDVEHIETNINV